MKDKEEIYEVELQNSRKQPSRSAVNDKDSRGKNSVYELVQGTTTTYVKGNEVHESILKPMLNFSIS